MKRSRSQIMLCFGTGCVASGAGEVKKALEEELANRSLEEEIEVVTTGCNGFCALGPVMVVYPEGIFYVQVKPEDVPHRKRHVGRADETGELRLSLHLRNEPLVTEERLSLDIAAR